MLATLASRLGVHVLSLCGLPFEVDLADPFERDIVAGAYETEVVQLLQASVRPGDCFCDCGAHIGSISVPVARRLQPGGEIYAFEPAPRTYARLSRNFELVRPRVTTALCAVPQALGARAARDAPIFVSTQHGWSTLSCEASQRGVALGAPIAEIGTTSITTLDEFFLGGRRRAPTVVKIDVEGFEAELLEGAATLLRVTPPRLIIIERNDALLACRGQTFDGIHQTLTDAGYHASVRLPGDVVYTLSG